MITTNLIRNYFFQSVYSQAIGLPNPGCNGHGPGFLPTGGFIPNGIAPNGLGLPLNGPGLVPNGLGLPHNGLSLAPGCPLAGFAPIGYGDVAVAGELPVGGSTTVAGQVPVIGYVTFEGIIPAGGLVSVANNCGCNGPF